MENWQVLKDRINMQLEDCRKHRGCSGNWNTVARIYAEVLNDMERIETGTQDNYVPFNGVWELKETNK